MNVGVLVPVGGFVGYLAEALDSVLAEGPAMVVVVDDGSTQPPALHPDHVARVTVVRREAQGGPAEARAAGLDALPAEIDLVALCDADDAWEPGKLGVQLRALEDDPEASVCFGRALVVGPDGRPTGERWADVQAGRHDPAAFAQQLFVSNPIPTSSILIRRSALLDVGGFRAPVAVAEDWELWLRIARAGHRFVCAPEARVRYRRHPGGLTADVAALAEAQLVLHAAYGDLVDDDTRAGVRASDLRSLARGRLRTGDHRGARAALGEVAGAATPGGPRAGDRALATLLRVPVARAVLGRRDPYRS